MVFSETCDQDRDKNSAVYSHSWNWFVWILSISTKIIPYKSKNLRVFEVFVEPYSVFQGQKSSSSVNQKKINFYHQIWTLTFTFQSVKIYQLNILISSVNTLLCLFFFIYFSCSKVKISKEFSKIGWVTYSDMNKNEGKSMLQVYSLHNTPKGFKKFQKCYSTQNIIKFNICYCYIKRLFLSKIPEVSIRHESLLIYW